MPSLSIVDIDQSELYTCVVEAYYNLDSLYARNDELFHGRSVGIAGMLQQKAASLFASVQTKDPHAAFLAGRAW